MLEVVERSPHKLVLEVNAIKMMRTEVEGKVKDGQVEIVCLDEIEHPIGAPKRLHLKLSPLTMVKYKSRK